MNKVKEFWSTFAGKIIIIGVGIFVIGLATDVAEDLSRPTFAEAASASTTAPPTTTSTSTTTTTVPVTTPKVTTPTTVRTTTPTTLGSAGFEQIFLQVIREASAEQPYNWVDTFDDQGLIEWGHAACGGFDDGLDLSGIAFAWIGLIEDDFGYDAVTDPVMTGYVIGAAVKAFCPWYEGMLDG
jgi:hypothetical protein